MSRTLAKRHHVVESVRPPRTSAGDAFTDLVLEVAWLGGLFTAAGETLAETAGQSLARWVILDAIEDGPATVAQIARRRQIARQAIQRVADLLERDGLVTYEANPGHRRARLLRSTPKGQDALRTISIHQKAWADALGTELGDKRLRQAKDLVSAIRHATQAREVVPIRDVEPVTSSE